jgi:hypothetical protein
MKTAESRRMMSAVLIALCFMGGIAGAASASCPRHTGDSTAKKPPPAPSAADRVDDEIESLPKRFLWVPFFVVFLGAAYLLSMALFGVVMLRATRLHAIPALAIALLPQVMSGVDWHFPLAVGMGSTLLTASFLLFKKSSVAGRQVAIA